MLLAFTGRDQFLVRFQLTCAMYSSKNSTLHDISCFIWSRCLFRYHFICNAAFINVFKVAGQLCTMYLICLTLIYKNKLCVYEFGIYWNQGNKWSGESNYSFPFLNSKTFLVWAFHYLLLIKVWYGLEAIPNLFYVCPKPTSECVFRRYINC